MDKNFGIEYLMEFTQADAVIILASDGKLIDAVNLKQSETVAEASRGMFDIAERFSKSITNGSVQQLIIRSQDGIYIAHRMANKNIVVAFAKDTSKYGMIALTMDRISGNVF
ncbi:MAG: hypothetical protein Q4G08_06705 [Capnocytophaga sp.]|nr:hypothetical protein [Capnocytophaga sp.]